jgi:hypothetical protein
MVSGLVYYGPSAKAIQEIKHLQAPRANTAALAAVAANIAVTNQALSVRR